MRNLGLHNLRDGGTVQDARGDSPSFAPRKPRHSSAGVTLIELLVVISILMLLAAMAIPAVRPALEGRRIREAARAINIYLGVAQGEAMRTGRPCGVILQCVDGLPQCSMILQQAIVPPPYAGDDLDSAVRLQVDSNRLPTDPTIPTICVDAQMIGGFNQNLVHVGDRMQINAQGPWYTIVGPIGNTLLLLEFDSTGGGDVPWTDTWSTSLPYQIIRQPIKSSARPLKLPPGAVVDLGASGVGIGTSLVPTGGGDSIKIMFSPNGSVESYYVGNDRSRRVIAPIFLLIGKRERVTDQQMTASSTEEDWPNWADPTNLWVTINPQTGMVRTAENYYDGSIDWNNRATAIRKARTFARQSKSMGGR